MLTELQLVLVASWMDLAVRIIFSLGLVMAIADMMELIRYIPMSKNPSGCSRSLSHKVLPAIHLAFAVWGAVLLALHVYAATKTPISMCMPKVHPLAGTLPSCFMVNFNCHYLGVTATNEE
ncbi:hypothetical protein PHYSODRAFT_418831, partial [Phytophthora sojae]